MAVSVSHCSPHKSWARRKLRAKQVHVWTRARVSVQARLHMPECRHEVRLDPSPTLTCTDLETLTLCFLTQRSHCDCNAWRRTYIIIISKVWTKKKTLLRGNIYSNRSLIHEDLSLWLFIEWLLPTLWLSAVIMISNTGVTHNNFPNPLLPRKLLLSCTVPEVFFHILFHHCYPWATVAMERKTVRRFKFRVLHSDEFQKFCNQFPCNVSL